MQTLLRRIHPVAGGLAILCIASFMAGSIIAEIYGDPQTIAATRHAILWGLLVLIPSLAFTGVSGYRAADRTPRGLALTKFKRMRVIATNGICVLVPCAFFLACRASKLEFDWIFYSVQSVELLAGSINLVLLSMSFHDGLHMARSR